MRGRVLTLVGFISGNVQAVIFGVCFGFAGGRRLWSGGICDADAWQGVGHIGCGGERYIRGVLLLGLFTDLAKA